MSSFYYDFILSERSTLAKVWLAAHWEKKLSKVQVFETNLISSVHDILHPITPIALRTSSHLLVGLARIYSRKAKYLLNDCSEALVNIKVAFRPGAQMFEEPKKKKRSQVDCPLFITEKVDLLDQWVPEASNAEMDCSLNQSKIEEITIQEEPMKVSSLEDYFDDEGFGDMFDPELTQQELEKGESSFLRIHSFADSDCVLEDSFSHSSSITDFGDPFLSLTPVKEADEINKLKNRTLETQSEIDLPKCVSELDEEMPKVGNFCPKVDYTTLRIEITNKDGVEQGKIVLDPIVEPSVKLSRKSLKRKLLIDSEISIDREEYFYQIRNASRLCRVPMIAPRTKCHMKQIRKNARSLFLSHQEFLAPCLQKLFERPKVKKNSMSSSHVEEEIAFSHIHENGEGHMDSVFIPVQDVEYSDNEDDVNIFHNEDPKSFPDETNSASSVEEDASTEQDEDITHDEFCAFVEASVLKSHPEPINIQQVIFQGSPTRKNVARRFTKCLIMQRDGRLRLDQASHFSGIYLYPGNNHVSLLVCS